MIQHRASEKHFITSVLTHLFPVLLFLLQLIGRVSVVATIIAGVLICTKAVIEFAASTQVQHPQTPPPPVMVVEPCCSCGMLYRRTQIVTAGRHIRLCSDCYHPGR